MATEDVGRPPPGHHAGPGWPSRLALLGASLRGSPLGPAVIFSLLRVVLPPPSPQRLPGPALAFQLHPLSLAGLARTVWRRGWRVPL